MKFAKQLIVLGSLLLFIALLAAVIAVSIIFGANYVHFFWIAWFIVTFGQFITGWIIFNQQRHEMVKIAWLTVVACIPIIGFLLFWIFGWRYVHYRKHFAAVSYWRRFYNLERCDVTAKIFNQQELTLDERSNFIFSLNLTLRGIYDQTEVKLYDGPDLFRKLFHDIAQAKEYIYLNYFLLEEGEVLDYLSTLLIEKVKAGVTVRLIYDDVGSYFLLRRRTIEKLVENGIKVAKFSKLKLPVLLGQYNFRNHRKDVIIDGKIAYTGGINIGDNYIHLTSKYGVWHDYQVRITGLAVISSTIIFLQDWYLATKVDLIDQVLPLRFEPVLAPKAQYVQIVDSGPHLDSQAQKQLILKLITTAKKRVWISTPYFLPTADIVEALKNAAIAGLDVRIIIPGFSDKAFVLDVSRCFYTPLLAWGVKIYEMKYIFNHAKIALFDNKYAYIGTTNLDFRSLFSDYQTLVFVTGRHFNREVEARFNWSFQNGNLIINNPLDQKNWVYRRLFLPFIKIFIPLL